MRVGNLGLTAQGAHFTGLWFPHRMRWWGNERVAKLMALVCLGCGNVKLYADDLEKLRGVTQEHPDWFVW